jgi:hypothetical protein
MNIYPVVEGISGEVGNHPVETVEYSLGQLDILLEDTAPVLDKRRR